MKHHSSAGARLVPATERGRRSRQRLLRAAERVFGERGYEETSIAEICREADCALGSFYVYFPDKRFAFVELVDSLGERLRAALTASALGKKGRFEIERAGMRAFFEFVREHKRLYRIVRQSEFVDEGAFHRYYQRFEEGYVAGLTRAMKRGELRRLDPTVVAYCLMGICDFLGMRWAQWQETDDAALDAIVDTAMKLVESGLAPRPENP